jgi:hypothetical protein
MTVPPTILVGETYFDTDAKQRVVVIEEVLDRTGPSPRRTGEFRVAGVDGTESGRAWIAPESVLAPLAPLAAGMPQPPRRGGPRPIAWVLLDAVSRVGLSALPHCRSDEERDVALALAECGAMGGDALRLLAKIFLAASRRDAEARRPR